MTALLADPGSFRDPSGQVFIRDRRVYRTVTAYAAADYEFVRDSGLLRRLAAEERIVGSAEVDGGLLEGPGSAARYVLEHTLIPYVSYPYEWPFGALKAAALHHLDLHLELLQHGATLSDASAYNVQFKGPRPVFIDVLSLRRYREGEYWVGHRQFCEQFLNPLLLRARLGVPHNAWFRGALEGIPTEALARLLRWRDRLSWPVLTHVILQARLQRRALDAPEESAARIHARPLPGSALRGMLLQMRRWVARLDPADRARTVWSDYARTHGYGAEEEAAKRRFVTEFVQQTTPGLLFDLGCNTGDYAALSVTAGAGAVIGFDADHGALEEAFARAGRDHLEFLPLVLDATNPSPDQGWRGLERVGFEGRARPDALLALAFVHHLAIGRNVPLDQVVTWLVGLAPTGVIEFVPKDDPTVRRMLALREDIFAAYGEAAFTGCLSRIARIVRSERVSTAGRTLFWYQRAS